MKYNVGDLVRIKSIDWYNKNKDKYGHVYAGNGFCFWESMARHCGEIMKITFVKIDPEDSNKGYYFMENSDERWTDEMIEGSVEETELDSKAFADGYDQGYDDGQHDMYEWILPDGCIFKDENGNVINASKIVLEKKKKEYPKTYEECSLINGAEDRISLSIIGKFTKLINSRNAYWKIAGEQMGLGKPWSPDYKNPDVDLYVIINSYNHVDTAKYGYGFPLHTFTFPTEEMCDAFKENFGPDIEICKEFL